MFFLPPWAESRNFNPLRGSEMALLKSNLACPLAPGMIGQAARGSPCSGWPLVAFWGSGTFWSLLCSRACWKDVWLRESVAAWGPPLSRSARRLEHFASCLTKGSSSCSYGCPRLSAFAILQYCLGISFSECQTSLGFYVCCHQWPFFYPWHLWISYTHRNFPSLLYSACWNSF